MAAVVAYFHTDVAHKGARRTAGHKVDGACLGVAAKQGALGSAQDLQAINVNQVRQDTLVFSNEHAIDINAHGWVLPNGWLARRHAAHTDRTNQARHGGRRHIQIRYCTAQAGGALHATLLHVSACDSGNRQGDILQALSAALGSYYDLFQRSLGP